MAARRSDKAVWTAVQKDRGLINETPHLLIYTREFEAVGMVHGEVRNRYLAEIIVDYLNGNSLPPYPEREGTMVSP